MEDAQRKANSHHVIEFNQCDTRFLVQKTINPREVQPTKNFTIRLNQRWCDCGNFQKVRMPCSHVIFDCKHIHHEYRTYINLAYTLENVLNIYRGLFGELCNEAYWRQCHETTIYLDLKMLRNSKGCLVSSHIHTEMDMRTPSQPKRCSMCYNPNHSKNK